MDHPQGAIPPPPPNAQQPLEQGATGVVPPMTPKGSDKELPGTDSSQKATPRPPQAAPHDLEQGAVGAAPPMKKEQKKKTPPTIQAMKRESQDMWKDHNPKEVRMESKAMQMLAEHKGPHLIRHKDGTFKKTF
ncbi:uncharacterized protein LOC119573732 [Penaeus monodon]|uniref:uncharacterized protein LOC119573732 n=1 Tax=Penaeus monodon TaxID=6687 RepID=UPI0018A7550E|nr:uncharacterized protein LOC119573732 [Penaeus monodon]